MPTIIKLSSNKKILEPAQPLPYAPAILHSASYVLVHIMEMAKVMNMRMITDGVESEAHASSCANTMCITQRWLFGKTTPLGDISR